MLFKELFPIALGGTGFVGLAGTSSYFLYQHVKINAIREEINKDLGELRDKILELIEEDSKVFEKPKKGKKPKIAEIKKKIQELREKNESKWKNYTDQVDEILKKYKEIIKRAKKHENNISESDFPNILVI